MNKTLRTLDNVLLCALVVAMCSQIDVRRIGADTFATEGYVTKQLSVALSDVTFLLVFGWFCVRTTMLRAWRKLWLPPLPCWALIAAMVISMLNSPAIHEAVISFLRPPADLDPEARRRLLQAPKEAVAEVVQWAAYFLAAPLLFVNLLLDRRDGELVQRRDLALKAFGVATALVAIIGALQLAQGGVPRGTWGSANLYGGFLALALPLISILLLGKSPSVSKTISYLFVVVFGLTTASPWAIIALLIADLGLPAFHSRSFKSPGLTGGAAGILIILIFLSWRVHLEGRERTALARARGQHYQLRVPSQKEPGKLEVKKQYVEWYAVQGFAAPGKARFATGVGPGNYQLNIGSYYGFLPNAEKMPPDSNNLYLVQTVSIGALGLGALLWTIGHFGAMAWRARRENPNDWLGAGVLASLVAWGFVNIFHALIVRGMGLVLAFLLSLCVVALYRRDDSEQPAAASTVQDLEKTP